MALRLAGRALGRRLGPGENGVDELGSDAGDGGLLIMGVGL